jgi:hypothetical protein
VEARKKNRSSSALASKDGRRPSTSEEYNRFESLIKRIVQVPKKEIDAARSREAVKDSGARKAAL